MVTLNTGSQPKDLSHRIPRQPLAHLDVEDPEGWDAIQPHPATATPGMNMGGMEQSQKKKKISFLVFEAPRPKMRAVRTEAGVMCPKRGAADLDPERWP